MLNHATERVNESENERVLSETQHRHLTAVFHSAEHNVKILQSELKRAIAKSRYFYFSCIKKKNIMSTYFF